MKISNLRLFFFVFIFSVLGNNSIAQEAATGNIKYEYKKYDKIDLGNIEVDGELVAPSDITVRETQRKSYSTGLVNKVNFDDFINNDILRIK